ncbi:MAG TPA: thiamine phosphate synthase [Candidatus Acidoferrales bacterium]|nr:thiamine phosphate synthase [Candidatus Acidoferrales bacterium]
MKPLADCKLYTFVDTAYLRGRAPETVAQQLCDGGSDLIQLRAKKSTVDEIRVLAERMLPVTRRAGVGLVINDHLEIAQAIGAEFCHLGQEDLKEIQNPKSEMRSQESPVRIGWSTHAPEQARRAMEAGADYIAIGPVYATATKPTARPVTLDYVRWAAAHATVPWFAIGGISLQTLDAVLAAGAKRICAVSAILNAPDVAKACAEFRSRLP